MAQTQRGSRTRKIGVVTSDKPDKTIVVSVDQMVLHERYKRFVKRSARFMAHDETNNCRMGDTVEIIESRPLSARKRWRVVRVVKRATGSATTDVAGEASPEAR